MTSATAECAVAAPVDEPQRPWAVMSPESLIRQAKKNTGLDHLGDTSFLERLSTMIEDLGERQEAFTYEGYVSQYRSIIHHLENRLRVESFLEGSPEALEHRIEQPVFITGPPRSGTTMLHNLLAQDPASRAFRYWELRHACRDKEEAVRISEQGLERFFATLPKFRRIHGMSVQGAEECHPLLANNFASPLYLALYPRAIRQLEQSDPEPILRDYRREVQAVALWSSSPAERLQFKNPTHARWIEALVDVFPGTRLVVTHRDPTSFVPSACSLAHSMHSLFLREYDYELFRDIIVGGLADDLRRHIAQRETIDPQQIFDVDYPSLSRRPLEVVERIYDHFGLELTDEARLRMAAWLEEHPHNRYGKHSYSMEEYALTEEYVEASFKEYRERFSRYF